MKKFTCLVILFLITTLTSTSFANTISIKERVKLQRAIENVYWEHRIWPDKNSGAKPALDQILPKSAIQEKVTDALQKSKALSMFWNREITPAQLQRELNRMAHDTKKADMLRELWQALGNNPNQIAEIMARPILTDRLIRNAYNYDSRFHGRLKDGISEELKSHVTPAKMSSLSGAYQEVEWVQVDNVHADSSIKTNSVELTSAEWNTWLKHLQEIFRRNSNLHAGQISRLQETDDAFFIIAILEMKNNRMKTATVEWRKTPFDVWWKTTKNSIPVEISETANHYKLPEIAGGCSDAWTPMGSIPDARVRHAEVWTGTELIVWGGILGPLNTGGRYDPAIDAWHPISINNEPSQRVNSTAVWTGTRMVVWGGWGGGTSDNVFNTGGLYDPSTDTWSPTSVGANVPSARTNHRVVWTGSEMIVWGGCPDFGCFSPLNTGGRYDPIADSWQPVTTQGAPEPRSLHTAVWTGNEMIIWGGVNFSTSLNTGGRYDPASDSWIATSITNAPSGRSLHSAIWDGSEMIVWGGCGESGCFTPLNDGSRYNPASDTWAATSVANAPQGRRGHSAIWDGVEMIIWGGCVDHDCSQHVFTGGKYDPVADSWTPTDTTGAPSGRSFHSGVWTGTEMIVWGGCVSGECEILTNTGGRYDPASDSWTPTSNEDAPSKRVNHSMIWTGAEMVVWGGFSFLPVFTGGIYNPATDHWTNVFFSNTPGARDGHTAVWTGTEMIIWGGREFGIGVTPSGARCDLSTQSCTETTFTNAPAARAFHTALWTGSEMIVWGGCATDGCDAYLNSGGRYDPVADSWTTVTQTNAPPSRFAHSAIFSGSEMIVWGGFPATNTGGRYDLAADTWSTTSLAGAPGARYRHTGIWSGTEMIIWGGFDGTNLFGDGARYNPASDSWSPVSNTSAPAPRWEHTAVWTDSEMIVWGGCADGPCNEHHLTGGRYNPVSDSWVPTNSVEFVPFARTLHTAVWSGSEMLIWGGWQDFSSEMTNTGARYCATPPNPDFSIICNPSSLITLPGFDVTSTCTITSHSGFSDAVDLNCANLPANVTCSFNPTPVTPPPNGSIDSVLTVSVGGSVPDGDYAFDVMGTSGVLSHSFAIDLTVTSVCNYSINPTNATYDASGGSGSVDVTALTGCAWTAVSNDSWISVTGGSSGNGNGTVDYTVDPNPDANQRVGTITIADQTFTVTQSGANLCLFCDDFEDGVLDPNWNYLKPAWSESGGFLIGTPARRKATAIATPVFAGCDTCSVEALMRTAGGIGNRVWLFGWFVDKANTIELMMKEESDKWVLKQRNGGRIVARAKAPLTIDPNVDYKAEIQFDGTNFQVSIDGVLIITMPKAAGTTPFGTVGFSVKSTTGSFGEINVN